MATLTGKSVAATYKDLLKVDSASDQAGVDGTLRKVEDGDATATSLSISTTAIAIDATDKLYLDGGGTTYIQESSDGVIDFYSDGVKMLTLTEGSPSTVVINEGSVDMDFRVEGNGEANLLFADGSTDRVGIGTSSPTHLLEIKGAHGVASLSAENGMVFIGDGDTGIEIGRDTNSPYGMWFQGKKTSDNTDRPIILNPAGDNVGIGELSPDGLLHLTSGTSDKPWLIVEQTSTSQQQGGNILFRNADTDTQLAGEVILGDIVWQGWNTAGTDWESACQIRARKDQATGADNDMGGQLQFYTTADGSSSLGDPRMTIRHTGNVGIGTTAPDSLLHLQSSTAGDMLIVESTDAGGTAAPDIVLWRNSSSPADDDYLGFINFKGEDGGGTIHNYATIGAQAVEVANTSEKGDLVFSTSNAGSPTERMRINYTGRVGIGTTSPETTLDVRSTGTQLQLEYDDSNAVTFAVSSGGDLTVDPSGNDITFTDTNSFRIHSVASSSSNDPVVVLKSTFDSTSHQGAQITYQTGHTDDYIADTQIIGDISFETIKSDNSTAMASALIRCQSEGTHTTSSSPAGLRFWTTPSGSTTLAQRMGIDNAGNVGIGVSSPSELLDVNGTVRAKALRLDEATSVNEGTITNTTVAGYSRLKALTNSGGGSTGVLIKGLDGGVEGQVLYIYKTSSNGILRIYNNSTNASAGDKILVPGCVADDDSDYITIPAGGYGGFTLVYDTSASENYWHLIASAPNAAVTA